MYLHFGFEILGLAVIFRIHISKCVCAKNTVIYLFIFCEKVLKFYIAKALTFFQQQYISIFDFMCARILNQFLTNNSIKKTPVFLFRTIVNKTKVQFHFISKHVSSTNHIALQ